jgi:Ca-activated chloride channel family protein
MIHHFETMRHWFAHPLALSLLALLPVLAALALWGARRRRRALEGMGARAALDAVLTVRRWPRWLRGACWALGLPCLAAGVAGPQWGRDWGQSTAPGRDLVVVLDCSRSMLAETPSRLEKARAALLDLVNGLRKRGGHRVALVTFAGRARLACPLTHDYDHFRATVESIEAGVFDSELGPGPKESSGTRIGAALVLAVESHDERFPGARDILLLSDGDDPARDDEWQAGVTAAKLKGIPVHVAAIGDSEEAHRIPTANGPLRHGDEEVRTRLEETPLRTIAEATRGQYVPAYTRTLPLGELYLALIATLPQREESDDALPVYRQRYPWFLLPAFLLLFTAAAVPDRPRRTAKLPVPADTGAGVVQEKQP